MNLLPKNQTVRLRGLQNHTSLQITLHGDIWRSMGYNPHSNPYVKYVIKGDRIFFTLVPEPRIKRKNGGVVKMGVTKLSPMYNTRFALPFRITRDGLEVPLNCTQTDGQFCFDIPSGMRQTPSQRQLPEAPTPITAPEPSLSASVIKVNTALINGGNGHITIKIDPDNPTTCYAAKTVEERI